MVVSRQCGSICVRMKMYFGKRVKANYVRVDMHDYFCMYGIKYMNIYAINIEAISFLVTR